MLDNVDYHVFSGRIGVALAVCRAMSFSRGSPRSGCRIVRSDQSGPELAAFETKAGVGLLYFHIAALIRVS